MAVAYCDYHEAPPLTSAVAAAEFREEFTEEFEAYFRDAKDYLRCIDEERAHVLLELEEAAARYSRFLRDFPPVIGQ